MASMRSTRSSLALSLRSCSNRRSSDWRTVSAARLGPTTPATMMPTIPTSVVEMAAAHVARATMPPRPASIARRNAAGFLSPSLGRRVPAGAVVDDEGHRPYRGDDQVEANPLPAR